MHSIVGASVSSNAMDAQARAAWLVRRGWRGLNDVEYVIITKLDTTQNTISVHVCMGIRGGRTRLNFTN